MRQCQECKYWTRYECEGNTYFWGRCSKLFVQLEGNRAEIQETVYAEVPFEEEQRPLDTDEGWGCVGFEEAA